MPARARAELNREAILAAASALVDEEGLDALTMRALANRLHASPMGLYRHFPSRQDLLNALVDQLLDQVWLPRKPRQNWESWLVTLVAHFRSVALAHPHLAPMVALRPPSSPGALRAIGDGLAALQEAGLTPRQAAHAYRALAAYGVGSVLLELGGFYALPDGGPGSVAATLDGEPELAGSLDVLRAALPYLQDHRPDREFKEGLRALLSGLASDRTTSQAATERPKKARSH